MRRALEGVGHDVCEEEDGVRGTVIAPDQALDLVITDILMPDQDGLETIRRLRRSRPNLRMIAISGGWNSGWTEGLRHAKRFGADLVLLKPFTMEELCHCVRVAFTRAA